MSKDSKDQFVQMLVKLFDNPEQNDLKNDIEKAKKIKDKSKFLSLFLKKYSDSKLDSKICQQIFYEIISKLIDLRKDFVPLMKIYMITDDKINAKALKNHFILKEAKMSKVESGDTDNHTYCKFGINLSCTYDIESYYHLFIKGILHYFQLTFKENYLYEYIGIDYFKHPEESKVYKEKNSSLENSLNNMLIDIDRVIHEDSNRNVNKNVKKIEHKMTLSRFGILRIRANLHKNEEIGNIYGKCKNDTEILEEVNKLLDRMKNNPDDDLYSKLIIFKDDIEKYLEKEKEDIKKTDFEITIAKKNAEIYSYQKNIEDIGSLKDEMKKLKEDNNKLNTKYQCLENENNKLNTKYQCLENEVKELKEKVEFMEPIVLSIICRKAINYSIIKILEKYKAKIKVIKVNLPNNDINYKITFIDSVNNISIDTLNDLIDNLFEKKDIFNKDSHLVKKDLPSFITDLWGKIKENLKLNSNEITAFDAIITEEIKSNFNFGAEDLSVKNYLQKVDIKEFGKQSH